MQAPFTFLLMFSSFAYKKMPFTLVAYLYILYILSGYIVGVFDSSLNANKG